MKEKNEDVDIEIIMGDDSALNFSDIKDSIKTLRPKDKIKKENIIIPKVPKKTQKNNNDDNK